MHGFSTAVRCKSLTAPSPSLLPEFQLQPPPDFSEKYNNFRKWLTYVSLSWTNYIFLEGRTKKTLKILKFLCMNNYCMYVIDNKSKSLKSEPSCGLLHTLSPLKRCFSRVLLLLSNAVQSCLAIALWRTAKQIKTTLPCNLEILDVVSFCIVVTLWLVAVNIWHDTIFSATCLTRELKTEKCTELENNLLPGLSLVWFFPNTLVFRNGIKMLVILTLVLWLQLFL